MSDGPKLRRWLALIVIACAAIYLIGNGRVPLWDRDEGWYARCSQQMWQSGDWVVPRFLDDLRTEKPVLVYWLQLGGYALFGGPGEFAARFYSGVMQVLAVAVLGIVLSRLLDPRRGLWTAAIYGTCLMAIISAKMCLTDATLMLFVVTIQMTLLAWYLGRLKGWAIPLAFVALGLGILTKGPAIVAPPLLTLAVLAVFDVKRWWGAVRPGDRRFWQAAGKLTLILVGGALIVLAICLPWVWQLQQRAPEWLDRAFAAVDNHVSRAALGHSGPPGYHAAMIWGMFFPWSLLIPGAAYIAWKQRHQPATRFAAAAMIGPWLFFDFVQRTKLPHYMLPSYPFVALLVADALVRCAEGTCREFSRKTFRGTVALWALVIGALASAPWLLARWDLDLPIASMAALSIAGFVFTIPVAIEFWKGRPYQAAGWMAGGFVLFVALLYGWMLPSAKFLHLSPQVAQILQTHGGSADTAEVGEVVSLVYPTTRHGYREPTMAFYQGGTWRELVVEDYLDQTPVENWPRLMIITDGIWSETSTNVRERIEILGRVRGFQYSGRGKPVELMVIRAKASEPQAAFY